MSQLRISLFGKLSVRAGDQPVRGFELQKIQELLAYLLLYRNRLHHREKLADLLWPNNSTSQSKKYLRQTLWQIQSLLDQLHLQDSHILQIDPSWLRVNGAAALWVDISEFEAAFELVKGQSGATLDGVQARTLRRAVQLYAGDLLEGWYQDWCIFERERFHNLYLAALDKLMGYCEARAEYEAGIAYGYQILRSDPARERTHRRLMRLIYLTGDRTGALRQYQRCAGILRAELDIAPSQRTAALYQQIQADQPLIPNVFPANEPVVDAGSAESLNRLRRRIILLHDSLGAAQLQVERDLDALNRVLGEGS